MKIALITIFPEMLNALNFGIPFQAQKKKILELKAFNPRDFVENAYRRIDDRPYGGGPGMVMQAEPTIAAIREAKVWAGEDATVIYLSPQGKTLLQKTVQSFIEKESLVLIAGRYEGIDERIITLMVDQECSIGDYVLSGGELPAFVLIDAISRLLPGVLNQAESYKQDSFEQGLLDYPHYTRPPVVEGMSVPDVLLSGDHEKIAAWRKEKQLEQTRLKRPDLLEKL